MPSRPTHPLLQANLEAAERVQLSEGSAEEAAPAPPTADAQQQPLALLAQLVARAVAAVRGAWAALVQWVAQLLGRGAGGSTPAAA